MPIYQNILGTVGRTPLVKLNRITAGAPATIALLSLIHISEPTRPY